MTSVMWHSTVGLLAIQPYKIDASSQFPSTLAEIFVSAAQTDNLEVFEAAVLLTSKMSFTNLKGKRPDTQLIESSSYAQEPSRKPEEKYDDLRMNKESNSKAGHGDDLDLDNADVRFQLMFGDIKNPTATELEKMDSFSKCGPNLQKSLLLKKGIIKGPQKGKLQKMCRSP